MPRGVPAIFDGVMARAEERDRREAVTDAPVSEILGTVAPDALEPQPETAVHDGVTVTDPPPPWEISGEEADSDARHFVEVPSNWTLRWINPRLLDSQGWRYWQPVMASDTRVKVKVNTMVTPENNIRRGGPGGDILAWMLTSWVMSRRALNVKKAAELAQSAVDRQAQLREEFARGTFGPYVKLTDAQHPSHTIGEGRTMRD